MWFPVLLKTSSTQTDQSKTCCLIHSYQGWRNRRRRRRKVVEKGGGLGDRCMAGKGQGKSEWRKRQFFLVLLFCCGSSFNWESQHFESGTEKRTSSQCHINSTSYCMHFLIYYSHLAHLNVSAGLSHCFYTKTIHIKCWMCKNWIRF